MKPPVLAFAYALAVWSNPVAAQPDNEMPIYDVERHCREVASFGGTYSAVMDQGCFRAEQQAYDGLKARWASLPQRLRRHCDEIARFGGSGNYTMLSGCVRAEEQAAGANSNRQFRR